MTTLTSTHLPGAESGSEPDWKITQDVLKARFAAIREEVLKLVLLAQELDWLGDGETLPPNSEELMLANTRDDVDFFFNHFAMDISAFARRRAGTTRCADLVSSTVMALCGDGEECLRLMRRCNELRPVELHESGDPGPDTFEDCFAREAYQRVAALPGLAAEFPAHLRHGAREMSGWPMIVTHHLDHAPEFARLAELLEVGAANLLDVGPRKRRGRETPLLQYLQPLIQHVDDARIWLARATVDDGTEADFWRLTRGGYFASLEPRPTPAEEAILNRAADLPPLTQETAREWSEKVVVPLIMLQDAGTRETCRVPALQAIWRPRAVQSRATFELRLHGAVSDTLWRFARPAEPAGAARQPEPRQHGPCPPAGGEGKPCGASTSHGATPGPIDQAFIQGRTQP